ncbi:S26 family signal peptidase ['Fragaria x ananassa' phyllody phytoplasma]|uniref:S26 family signal peptidase n=1 Tax='Fragaria x ananassa' phyllody phytoplasma TaxID=2358428 RepID=A0ABS5K3K9_9MOLU|nr:S26 family signal peptidase ['Fragaria x ananassa' phyllody phytoplasma]MBS2126477.1 S26 family signal peptidase ['Fragaria x ananassa' phyllody phytoplasma]
MSISKRNHKEQTISKKSPIAYIKKTLLIIFDIFLFYLLIVVVGQLFFPKYSTKWLGISAFSVASGSMEPYIKGPPKKNPDAYGDFVFIKGIWDPTKLKPVGGTRTTNPENKPKRKNDQDGDIVVFENPFYELDPWSEENPNGQNKLIIHRIIYNDPDKKIIGTWGDANSCQSECEEKIPYDKIVGKYIFKDSHIIPNLKTFLKQYWYYFPLVGIYLIIFFYFIRTIIKNKE